MLALKENQGNLYREVQSLFAYAEETEFRQVEHDTPRTASNGHGRIEYGSAARSVSLNS
jgi:hypothetical protein